MEVAHWHIAARANAAACPHPAEEDMRALAQRGSGFDPKRPFGGRSCCNAQRGFPEDGVVG
jgi:hypothetical protein